MRDALRHEIDNVRRRLDEQVARIRSELGDRLHLLMASVEALASEAEATGNSDPSTLERTTVLERTAQRLADFRTTGAPSLGDSVRLLKKLDKATAKIRR